MIINHDTQKDDVASVTLRASNCGQFYGRLGKKRDTKVIKTYDLLEEICR